MIEILFGVVVALLVFASLFALAVTVAFCVACARDWWDMLRGKSKW